MTYRFSISAFIALGYVFMQFAVAAPHVVTTSDDTRSFGTNAALRNDLLAVSAVRNSGNAEFREAAVYIFLRGGDGWREVQKVTVPGRQEREEWSCFGCELAWRGDTLLVGADREAVDGVAEAGAIFIFERVPGEERWQYSGRLTSGEPGKPIRFASAMALHGDTLMVGAMLPGSPYNVPDGAVFLFEHDANRNQWQRVARFEEPPEYSPLFGTVLDVHGDSAVSAAGSGGVVLVYERDAAGWYESAAIDLRHAEDWTDPLISQVAIHGNTLAAGLPTDPALGAPGTHGRVSIQERRDGVWQEVVQLSSPNPEDPQFGNSLHLDEDVLVVMPQYRSTAYVYRRMGGEWRHVGTANDPELVESNAILLDLTPQAFVMRGNNRVLVYYLRDFAAGDENTDAGGNVTPAEPAAVADTTVSDDIASEAEDRSGETRQGSETQSPVVIATAGDAAPSGGGAFFWLAALLFTCVTAGRRRTSRT